MLMRRENARMTGAASAVLGGTFVIGALARASDGFSDNVGRMMPATVLGLLAGVALLVAAFGLLSLRYWGWKAGLGAHVFAMAVVLIGMFTVAAGYGPVGTSLVLPIVMLGLLALSFFAIWRSRPRNPIRRAQHKMAARMY